MWGPLSSTAPSFNDAPGLRVALPFFLSGPAFIVLAGALLIARPSEALVSSWSPLTVALTHLGTLGFLLMVMIGALYQVMPVVAGSSIRATWLAPIICLLLGSAASGFVGASLLQEWWLFVLSSRMAATALLVFLLPTSVALFRGQGAPATLWGLRLAVAALVLTGSLGVLMSQLYGSAVILSDRGLAIQLHLSLGFLCWVGGLIVAVSWQVIPMFYLAGKFPRGRSLGVLFGIALSLVLIPTAFLAPVEMSLDATRIVLALGAAPAALAVWAVHPTLVLRALGARRRRRPDATLEFWKMGLMAGPLVIAGALSALLLNGERWPILFGWLAIWVWAGTIVHGMLHRIVPFLVWLKWLSDLTGRGRVPTTRQLLPDTRTRWCLRLHAATSAVGIVAIVSQRPLLASLTGGLLVATGVSMIVVFVAAVSRGNHARTRLSSALPIT